MVFYQVQSRTVAPDQKGIMSFSGIDKFARHQHPTRPCRGLQSPLSGLCGSRKQANIKDGPCKASNYMVGLPFLRARSQSPASVPSSKKGAAAGDRQRSSNTQYKIKCVQMTCMFMTSIETAPSQYHSLDVYHNPRCAMAPQSRADCSTCGERCGFLSPLSCC